MIHGGFVLAASAANLVSWRANEQLLRDPLTGLASRIVLGDRLELALARSRRSGRPLALLFLDLDRFKLVNDSLGHTVGDRLLQLVSARLEECRRASDTAARFGGDEFAVLCEDLDDPQEAIRVAERIQAALAEPCDVNGHQLVTGASIGIATSEAGQQTAEELMRDADTAMYRAKQQGKNRIELFDAELRASLLRELEFEVDLRHALERDELRLHYQPEVRLATGQIESVEALLRWEHPRRGLVPPSDFIPLAELTGLIEPIGTWVIQEACRQAQRWRTIGADPELTIRVNVSAGQLTEPRLRDVIAQALADTDTRPEQLCLEITESALAEDSEVAVRVLAGIRELGVQLAVDDFGTGYSSLDRLRQFNVDVLKIDQVFVRGLNESPDDAAIVDAIISMAHALNLSVTAEGIEEPHQLASLRRLDCDTGQGFLFSAPVPPSEIVGLLMPQGEPVLAASELDPRRGIPARRA